MKDLLSVGIDVGTTTTQLVFSRLTVENQANAFCVPQFDITKKEILYRSQIHFTPLLSENVIDFEGVRQIIDQEYQNAGIQNVDTGAVIITGETARKENARQVLDALSGYAGDFVVATAGAALEGALAGKGSGAAAYSEQHQCAVLNMDIGGGTSNFALFENGKLCDTGCVRVGGRLMEFDKSGRCTHIASVLRPFFDEGADPVRVCEFLVEILEEAVGLRPTEQYKDFLVDKLCKPAPILSFSGGVADLIDDVPREDFAYGDLGVLLGRAIYKSRLCKNPYIKAKETIRATVIGAGSHSTELSGSTIFYDKTQFPIKNLPVVALTQAQEEYWDLELLRTRLSAFEHAVLALKGKRNPSFEELCKLADRIATVLKGRPSPLVVALETDIGKALGQALGVRLEQSLVCLDGVKLPDGAYLDIGEPILGGQVLPVVIKTLIL